MFELLKYSQRNGTCQEYIICGCMNGYPVETRSIIYHWVSVTKCLTLETATKHEMAKGITGCSRKTSGLRGKLCFYPFSALHSSQTVCKGDCWGVVQFSKNSGNLEFQKHQCDLHHKIRDQELSFPEPFATPVPLWFTSISQRTILFPNWQQGRGAKLL